MSTHARARGRGDLVNDEHARVGVVLGHDVLEEVRTLRRRQKKNGSPPCKQNLLAKKTILLLGKMPY